MSKMALRKKRFPKKKLADGLMLATPVLRVRITRKTGVASIRPSANFFGGNVFSEAYLGGFFFDFSWGLFGPLAAPWARVRIPRPCASNLAGRGPSWP